MKTKTHAKQSDFTVKTIDGWMKAQRLRIEKMIKALKEELESLDSMDKYMKEYSDKWHHAEEESKTPSVEEQTKKWIKKLAKATVKVVEITKFLAEEKDPKKLEKANKRLEKASKKLAKKERKALASGLWISDGRMREAVSLFISKKASKE